MHREFFAGGNFSGRSEAMLSLMRGGALGEQTFFIGPYAEAALSGLSSSVTDEMALYRARPERERIAFNRLDIASCEARKPQHLSGGEQVLLALHCFSRSALNSVAVDTALEQLDQVNRDAALDYLARGDFNVALIDNRTAPAGWIETPREIPAPAFAIDWSRLDGLIVPQRAAELEIRWLNFAYGKGRAIFREASATLSPGHAYRLYGANGAGKTTLLKILAGALVPTNGEITLGGVKYQPWRDGKSALAMATQNPDQQWCGATLSEDMTRRRKALGERGPMLNDTRLTALAHALGIESLDQHLYELPLAARKRVSWLWPLAGAHPWITLDEPTLGQDQETRANFAALLARLCSAGYGILLVTHDDEFAGMLPHRVLQIEQAAISQR